VFWLSPRKSHHSHHHGEAVFLTSPFKNSESGAVDQRRAALISLWVINLRISPAFCNRSRSYNGGKRFPQSVVPHARGAPHDAAVYPFLGLATSKLVMIASSAVSKAIFRKLQKVDTCTMSNAIERLNGRVRNEGSISGSVLQCMFPNLPPTLGYAVTGRMRSTTQPVVGRTYHENLHWWRYVETIPEPRVMVVEDADETPGAGALVGEIHAVIAMALKCVGYVTNGSVRDLPSTEALGFQMFAGGVSVTHMYAHISQHGVSVKIGGLEISPGDLIHGDRHGVHVIPLSIAPDIPATVSAILDEERELKKFCQSPGFTVQRLEEKLRNLPGDGFETPVDGC